MQYCRFVAVAVAVASGCGCGCGSEERVAGSVSGGLMTWGVSFPPDRGGRDRKRRVGSSRGDAPRYYKTPRGRTSIPSLFMCLLRKVHPCLAPSRCMTLTRSVLASGRSDPYCRSLAWRTEKHPISNTRPSALRSPLSPPPGNVYSIEQCSGILLA